MKRKIYWSSIEYLYKSDSEEFGELVGGFVYVFIKAIDVREALSKIICELNNGKLDPIEIEFIKPYEDDLEWETSDQTKHYLDLFEKAKNSDNLVFDDFHAYEKE
jgi:hypothetical protein